MEDWVRRLKTVNLILGGGRSVSLHQEFLIRSNHTDLQLLKIIKVRQTHVLSIGGERESFFLFLYLIFRSCSLLFSCTHSLFYIFLVILSQESGRNSITHNATVIANGLMHYSTTSDVFLRENLDWLKRASNWAKFTATASLGVIHYVSLDWFIVTMTLILSV